MNKKRRALLLVLLASVVGVIAWRVWPPRELMYQNRPLSAWLKDMQNWAGDTNHSTFVAFREMGTNAIPDLLKVLQAGGSPFEKMIMRFNRSQSVVSLPFEPFWTQPSAAGWALYAMGTNARPALPVLTDLLFHTNALTTVTIVLAGIGPEAYPILIAALTNQNYRIRNSATFSFQYARSDFDADFDQVVPALITSLQDPTKTVRYAAVSTLGQLHAKPELAVPALTNAFSSTDAFLRSLVMISLGQFEDQARQALPIIEAALNDNDQTVRENAGLALKKIDPQAAANAGVQ